MCNDMETIKRDEFGQEYEYAGEHEANQEKLKKLQSELVKLRSRFFGTGIASEENKYEKEREDFILEQDLMRICFLNGAKEAGFGAHQASFMFKYIFQFILMVRRENYDIIRGKIIVPKSRKDEKKRNEKEKRKKKEKETGKEDIKTVLKEILQRIEKTPEEDRSDREREKEKSLEREAKLSLERKGRYLTTDSKDVW